MPSSGLHLEEVCRFLYSTISRRETRNGKHTRLFLPGNHTHFPRRRLRTDMVNTLVTSGPSIWSGNTNISRPLPWAYLFQSSKALSSYIPFTVYHEFASLIYRTYFHEDFTYTRVSTQPFRKLCCVHCVNYHQETFFSSILFLCLNIPKINHWVLDPQSFT